MRRGGETGHVDPDRLRAPQQKQGDAFEDATFEQFVEACGFGDSVGQTAVLAEPTSSQTMMRLRDDFVGKGGQWFTYSPVNDDNSRAGTKLAFGQVLRPQYDLNCQVIVTIDADPLMMDPGSIANAVSFAKGRDADAGANRPDRLPILNCLPITYILYYGGLSTTTALTRRLRMCQCPGIQ